MDSIGIDENNSPVIFEYKRSQNENVINQGLFYLDWLLDHKADFELLVMKKLGKEKAANIDWSVPCVMCIASDFTKFDEHAINQMQRNIKLIKYKKYDAGMLLFEFINAPQPITVVVTDDDKDKKKHKEVSFNRQLEDAPEKIQTMYESIKDYILSLGDDISESHLKLYVAFRKVKNFACVQVYKQHILIFLRLDPDSVSLRSGKVEDVRAVGHWGTGELRLTISGAEDFENAKALIDRAYCEN